MFSFEEDYFDEPVDTFNDDITELARRFVNDPYKAPEQKEQAHDYLDRWAAAVGKET